MRGSSSLVPWPSIWNSIVERKHRHKLGRHQPFRLSMYRFAWVHLVLLSGCILRVAEGQCDLDERVLYPFGPEAGDALIIGDDGPPGTLDLREVDPIELPNAFFRFYGYDYTKLFINLNGQLSFGDATKPDEDMSMTDFFPYTAARPDPPFATGFWNDLFADGNGGVAGGEVFFRGTTDPDTIHQAHTDIGIKEKIIHPTMVIIATWYQITSFDEIKKARFNTSHVPQTNTYQIVLITDDQGLSFMMFNYFKIDWYLAHSLPAVAMLNQGRGSSVNFNLFASGSEMMLDLDDMCANAGVNGRFIFQTNLDRIRLLDQPSPSILETCYLKENSMYPYGEGEGDTKIIHGDDAPTNPIHFSNPVTYYGGVYSIGYININGPISFNGIFPGYTPSTIPEDQPPFLAAFWNDILLSGTGVDSIYYRLTTDSDLLERFKGDAGQLAGNIDPQELLIVTWDKVQFYNALSDDPTNTFQVLFGYEPGKSYTVFIYAHIGWYQDVNGHFALSVFNKGEASKVLLNVGPPPGPEFFYVHQRGNSVNRPGMFVYITGVPVIMKQNPTCTCRISSKKWVQTYDGLKHPLLYYQKNRISQYKNGTDHCKFQLTIKTVPSSGGSTKVQSVAFAFGVNSHTTTTSKFDKNIVFQRFGQAGLVEFRGRQISGARNINVPFKWKVNGGLTRIAVYGDEYTGWVLNSTTCPFRLLYAPHCPDPIVVFTINKARYKPQRLIGMCQDCNGSPDNDWRPCDDNTGANDWDWWKSGPDVSQTCSIDD